MRDPFQWGIGIGRWGGLAVRLHVLFLAFAAATLYYYWPGAAEVGGRDLSWIVLVAMLLLFASVLVHELAHALVARRFRAAPDTITLGPLGGLTAWRSLADPRAELALLAVGPLANLALALALAVVVLAVQPDQDLGSLFNPLAPALPAWPSQWPVAMVTVALWINWLLFLINILPAHPFDGARILRGLLRLTYPAWSAQRVAEVIAAVAVGLSVAFAALSAVLAKHATGTVGPPAFPIWSVLLLLAIVLLVSARRELLDIDRRLVTGTPARVGDEAGLELDTVSTARAARLPGPPPPAGPAWGLEDSSAGQRADLDEIEAEEERQVDGILSRLHAHGMDSLTAAERRLLDRVSARYRSRLGKRS